MHEGARGFHTFDNLVVPTWISATWRDAFSHAFQNIEHLSLGGCVPFDCYKTLELPPRLVCLRMWNEGGGSFEHLKLPATLRILELPAYWSGPIVKLPLLPPSLQELHFGREFDADVTRLELPCTLRVLTFGELFDHPVETQLRLPATLTHLKFCSTFCRYHFLEKLPLPPGLTQLDYCSERSLTCWNPPHSLRSLVTRVRSDIPLPPNLTELQHLCLDHAFLFPVSLTSLTLMNFHSCDLPALAYLKALRTLDLRRYNRPFSRSSGQFPASLTHLDMKAFNQPLGSTLHTDCPSLSSLKLGNGFSHPWEASSLPDRLQYLELPNPKRLGRPVILPAGLDKLVVKVVDECLHEWAWPHCLHTLVLGPGFPPDFFQHWISPAYLSELQIEGQCDIATKYSSVRLPSSLRCLRLVGEYNQSISDFVFPAELSVLELGGRFNQPMQGVQLPHKLAELHFSYHRRLHCAHAMSYSLADMVLPSSVVSLTLPHGSIPKVLPSQLKWIRLSTATFPSRASMKSFLRDLALPPQAVAVEYHGTE